MSADEFRLHDSLTNRPKEIETRYAQSVTLHGRRFQRGDDEAYSSLAHTLLVLNTGLINLINRALSSDVMDRSECRRSLLSLSESAATTTLRALSYLNERLVLRTAATLTSSELRPSYRKEQGSPPQNSSVARPAPSPFLARGGWVRSKSGSSVVSAASARKLAASNDKHKRNKSSLGDLADVDVSRSCQYLQDHQMTFSCPCQGTHRTDEKQQTLEWLQEVAVSENVRPPSMLLVPADYFDNLPQISHHSSVPPIPPKIPLQTRPHIRSRPRPPSAATFLSASTRIGEIPVHKWPEYALLEEQMGELPLPCVVPPPLELPKKKGRGFRIWKKNPKTEVAVA